MRSILQEYSDQKYYVNIARIFRPKIMMFSLKGPKGPVALAHPFVNSFKSVQTFVHAISTWVKVDKIPHTKQANVIIN